jgi:DNA-binding transcriptional regulator GbsR (MarR family)
MVHNITFVTSRLLHSNRYRTSTSEGIGPTPPVAADAVFGQSLITCGSFAEYHQPNFSLALQKELNVSNSPNEMKQDPYPARGNDGSIDTSLAPFDSSVQRAGSGMDVETMDDVHLEVIEICVRVSQALGIPRSMGEIFGLIFSAPRPLNFDDVVRSLGISNGSASHGLRKMCRLGIIRTCYVPKDRRDHYTFESSFRSIALALLEENLLVHVCWADERIERLRARVNGDTSIPRTLVERIDVLSKWNAQARSAMNRALEDLE